MNGAEQFDAKIEYLEKELTALKTGTVKSSALIATTEKTATISFTMKGLEPVPYVQTGGGRQNAIITLSGEGNFTSAVYIDGVGTNYGDRVVDIARLNNNRYRATLYSSRQSDIDSLNNGGSPTASYTIRAVATSDFSISVGYENNPLGV